MHSERLRNQFVLKFTTVVTEIHVTNKLKKMAHFYVLCNNCNLGYKDVFDFLSRF